MAQKTHFVHLAIFSLLTYLSPLVSSRTFFSSSETCTLNVTDSLHRATRYFPGTDQSQQRLEVTSLSSASALASLKLHIYPRESLHDSGHNDYKSRVLTRLVRDTARANLLQTRLDLAMGGIKKSDLHPLETTSLESPIVSGTSQGSGEYFSYVGVGHPPRQLYMVIDTGSDVSWVQCEPCSVCYTQSDPVFNPVNSTSFVSLPCDAPKCRALEVSECHSGRCLYEVSYGDGSYTVGEFATETMTFDGGAIVDNFAIGCGHNNKGLFIGAGGLLGLGGGDLSFPSQINATSFSYCLVDRDSASASTLEFTSAADSSSHHSPPSESPAGSPSPDSPPPETASHHSVAAAAAEVAVAPLEVAAEAVVSAKAVEPEEAVATAAKVAPAAVEVAETMAEVAAPLMRNPQLETFYYVGLTGMRVGGESVALPSEVFEIDREGNGGVIIDSGTAVTRLETRVYEAVRDEFRRGAGHLPAAEGVAIFDTCYDLKGRSSVAVPTVEMVFSGRKRLLLPAKNYMIPVDSEGTFCFAFARTTSSMSIIGNVQQQGTRVEFDLVNSRVTFQPNRC